MKKTRFVLASGGLDSYVTAHYVKNKTNNKLKLLFFDYGQKALKEELFCVKNLAKEIRADLNIIKVPWLGKASTSLINKNKETGKSAVRTLLGISIGLSFLESVIIIALVAVTVNKISNNTGVLGKEILAFLILKK